MSVLVNNSNGKAIVHESGNSRQIVTKTDSDSHVNFEADSDVASVIDEWGTENMSNFNESSSEVSFDFEGVTYIVSSSEYTITPNVTDIYGA